MLHSHPRVIQPYTLERNLENTCSVNDPAHDNWPKSLAPGAKPSRNGSCMRRWGSRDVLLWIVVCAMAWLLRTARRGFDVDERKHTLAGGILPHEQAA